MANRVVSWVLTAHDRTGAAFASVERKLRTARMSTEDHKRAMDGLDNSARRTSRGMDDSGAAITRQGRASKGAQRDNDGLRSSIMRLAAASGFLKSMMMITAIPAVAAAANLAGAAIRSLAAGFFALGGAIGPAAGALAALPGLLGAAIQGFSVFKFSTSGIGAALKAMESDQLNAGRTASQAASKMAAGAKRAESAQEGVRTATRSLAQAQQQAADQIAAAMRQIEQAQRRLTETQQQALLAQQRLSEARREAARDIDELRRRVDRLALSEEEAIFALQDAADELANANIWKGFAPDDEVFRKADLAHRKALANLDDIRNERAQANEELAEADREGVEGSDAVEDAQRALLRAQQDIADAARDVKDAQTEAARAQVEGAENVAEAQYQLARAIKAAGEAMDDFGDSADSAGQKAANAFDKLNPAAQRFATFLNGLRPQMDALKDAIGNALFPSLERSINRLLPLLPMVQSNLAATAGAMGQVAERGAAMMSSGPFAADVDTIMQQNTVTVGRMGDTFLSLMNALRHVMVAAGPLVDWITNMAVAAGEWISKAAEAGRESGRMAAFFERTREVLTTLGHIIRNVGDALFTIFRAGVPLGNDLLASLERITAKWAEWLRSVEGQSALATWFNDSRAVLHELGLLVGDLAKAFAGLGAGPEMAELVSMLRTDLLPALVRLMEVGGQAFSEQFIETTVRILELFTQLAGQGGPLIIFLDILGKVFGAFAWAIENIPGIAQLVTTLALFRATLAAVQVIGFVTGLEKMIPLMMKFEVFGKLAAAAQWLWNLAMAANPIVLVIGVIALLVAGLIAVLAKTGALGDIWNWLKDVGGAVFGFLKDVGGGALNFLKDNFLYLLGPIGIIIKHFDTLRDAAGAALGWIVDKFGGLIGFITDIPEKIGRLLGNIGEIMKEPFRLGINGIIWLLNRFIDVALAPLHVLNAIPGLGKVIPDVPKIPSLATGGRVLRGGLSWVGEEGPELAYLPTGARVINNSSSTAVSNMLDLSDYMARAGGSSQPVTPPPAAEQKAPLTVNQTFHNSQVDAQGSAEAIHWLLKSKGA